MGGMAKELYDSLREETRSYIRERIKEVTVKTDIGVLPGHNPENMTNIAHSLLLVRIIGVESVEEVKLLDSQGNLVSSSDIFLLTSYMKIMALQTNLLHNARAQLLAFAQQHLKAAEDPTTDERQRAEEECWLEHAAENARSMFDTILGDFQTRFDLPA